MLRFSEPAEWGRSDVKLLLRDVVDSDLPILYEHQRDPEAHRLAAFTPRDEPTFMKHWRDNILGDPAVAKKTIVFEGQVVGFLSSFERDGKREIGYWIARSHWGRGVASEGLRRFLIEHTARPLYAYVAKANPASVRVLEKCGFTIVGESAGSPSGRGTVVVEWILELCAKTRD